ncbi:MAG: acyl carrier protein [Deferribacterales bacterium]|jgi:acyl carrier protein
MPDTKQWLTDWFSKKDKFNPDDENMFNANYFELDIIDSLEVIFMIEAIEKEFDITFTQDDFQDRKFATVSGLSEIITKHLEG